MKELGEGLAGPVLRGGASVVLDAVGEDEVHVLQELGRGGVLKLVNLVADGRQVHGLTDHIVVIRDLYTARKKQDTDAARKKKSSYFSEGSNLQTQWETYFGMG